MYKNLKHYRRTIHLYLDEIWKIGRNNRKARTSMYHWLSVQLDIPLEQTHASMFNRNQCKKAIKILRNKYIELYGHDIPYKRKEKKLMKISTKLLQEMVSKSIKGAGNNNLIPITSLLVIEVLANKLTLKTTDGSNYLYVKELLEGEYEDFYSIVNADKFAKLISKTTSEYIEILNENSYLSINGNGKYKLEIAVNSDKEIVKFPTFDIKDIPAPKQLDANQLKNLLKSAKVAVAETMEIPCLTGYYVSDKVVTTNREMVCLIEDNLTTESILISSSMAELLQLLDGNDVSLIKDDNKLLFETNKISIYGKELEGKELYPVTPVENLAKSTYDNSVIVNKNDLLNVLDRMELFVTDNEKNGVYLRFTNEGLEIQSQKSNAIELLSVEGQTQITDFQCLADIKMLKSQVQAVIGNTVEICYGQSTSIKIKEGNTTMILSLIDKI